MKVDQVLFDYDDTNEKSIVDYAKKLENMTFREILKEYNASAQKEYVNKNTNLYNYNFHTSRKVRDSVPGYIHNTNAKGQLGGFIEKYYFGYDPNSRQDADFDKVGIEVKQTPIDITTKGEMRAGERLSITNISYRNPVEDDFYKSHLWDKIKKILLVQYLRDKSKDRMDYEIKYVNLFSPPKRDLDIIKADYAKINSKIKAGLAHEISEGDTFYLGACTKGASAAKSLQPQYYGDHILAKKRNFCFKQSYMNYILQNYVLKDNVPCESIIGDESLENTSFEEFIINKINSYQGKSDKELCILFNREYNNNKAQWIDLTYRMLGIKSNRAEEFEKANIVAKAIRIETNGKIRENMSFPPFKFKELVKETWESSTIYNYFESTKLLFVVFESDGEKYVLKGAQLWNMPISDLEGTVKEEWTEIRNAIQNGIIFEHNFNIPVKNNLPKIKYSKILHVRPHAAKAAYSLKDGFKYGDIQKDANELPDGQWMTTQSFWLNNDYILSQLEMK